MNELQAKLARRRSLNGELGGAPAKPNNDDGSSIVGTLSRETSMEIRKEVVETQPKTGSSSQSELQAKLARRRNMNGEQVTPQKGQPITQIVSQPEIATKLEGHTNEASETHVPVVASEHVETSEEPVETVASAQTLTPAWLDDASVADAPAVFNPHTENNIAIDTPARGTETFINHDMHEMLIPAEESTIASFIAVDNSSQISAAEATQEPAPELVHGASEISHDVEADASASALVTASPEPETLPLVALDSTTELAAVESSPEVPEISTVDTQQSVDQVSYSEAVLDKAESPMDEEIPTAIADVVAEADLPRKPTAAPTSKAVPVPIETPSPEASFLAVEKVAVPFTLESPAANSGHATKTVIPPQPVEQVSNNDRQGSHSPAPSSRVSWSPLRSSVAAPSASLAAPQRANTSTGARSGSSSTSISPVRRTASLSGAPSFGIAPPASASGKRSSWYPGKFLMEGLSSKQNTPRLKMNPEVARNHYADLMSSSAKDFSSEESTSSASTSTGASKDSAARLDSNVGDHSPTNSYGVSSSLQREEALRAAELPDMVAIGTSDDIIDKVLELSRENGQLKKEVAMLRSEVQRQKAIIAALSGENIDILPPAAPVDRKLEFMDNDAQKDSATAVDVTGSTSRGGGSAAKAAPAGGGTPGAASAGTKARASKRFGARGFYSNYGGEGGEDEDSLFGNDDTAPEPGTGNFNLSKLALDDLGDGTGTTPRGRKISSEGVDSSAQSLDRLLNSVPGSGHRDHRDSARGLVGEKTLVQSFMSTSMPAHAKPSEDRTQEKGDWSERFGSLGLISSNAEVDDHLFNEEKDNKAQQRAAATVAQNATMDYQEFLSKFTKTTELVDMTRDFIFSILGPNGDATPPQGRKKLNYIFYGLHKLDLRCRDFFDQVEQLFSKWPAFSNESDERLICARDGVEQYVMQRIGEYAFKSVVDAEGDDILLRRMKLLSFLKPEALDIKPDLFNETLLAIAGDELRKINSYKTPGDKVACVVKSASVIFRSLSLSKSKAESGGAASGGDDTNIAGADDFLPLFIWVVMRSNIPRLCTTVAYVHAFLNPARLMGKWGYCLINLSSAMEFVKYVESDQLIIDPREFDMKLMEAERELNGGFL